MKRLALAMTIAACGTLVASSALAAPAFSYDPPGELVDGSGEGRVDTKVYAPEMRFPMESGPAYANSQVWGRGGSQGGGGSQCDAVNFSYPWHDNYCESRTWDMPLCPSGEGHQGQDIRAADCKKDVHWVVAAADGTITNIGNYSVYLTTADGTRFDYLHMSNVAVSEGEKIKRGQHLGKVSNAFNGTPTTVHLHFNIRQNVKGIGSVYVPTYMSLVQSYEYLLGIRTNEVDAGATPPPPPAVPAPTSNEAPLPAAEPDDVPPSEDSGCALGSSAPTDASLGIVLAVALGIVSRRRRTWS